MKKIESIAEYQQLAKRTCPDLPGELSNHRHMDIGVITEIGELFDIFKKNLAYGKALDIVNLGEELADTSWYIVNKATFHNITLEEDLYKVVGEFKDILNTQIFTTTELSIDVKSEGILLLLLRAYTLGNSSIFDSPVVQLASLACIAEYYGLDYFQCLTNNIDKLKVRYPEKFTEEAALSRDLEAERKELEKE
jgi:NTP pyrophosphatase (non-canonical NTP hydrolase)